MQWSGKKSIKGPVKLPKSMKMHKSSVPNFGWRAACGAKAPCRRAPTCMMSVSRQNAHVQMGVGQEERRRKQEAKTMKKSKQLVEAQEAETLAASEAVHYGGGASPRGQEARHGINDVGGGSGSSGDESEMLRQLLDEGLKLGDGGVLLHFANTPLAPSSPGFLSPSKNQQQQQGQTHAAVSLHTHKAQPRQLAAASPTTTTVSLKQPQSDASTDVEAQRHRQRELRFGGQPSQQHLQLHQQGNGDPQQQGQTPRNTRPAIRGRGWGKGVGPGGGGMSDTDRRRQREVRST